MFARPARLALFALVALAHSAMGSNINDDPQVAILTLSTEQTFAAIAKTIESTGAKVEEAATTFEEEFRAKLEAGEATGALLQAERTKFLETAEEASPGFRAAYREARKELPISSTEIAPFAEEASWDVLYAAISDWSFDLLVDQMSFSDEISQELESVNEKIEEVLGNTSHSLEDVVELVDGLKTFATEKYSNFLDVLKRKVDAERATYRANAKETSEEGSDSGVVTPENEDTATDNGNSTSLAGATSEEPTPVPDTTSDKPTTSSSGSVDAAAGTPKSSKSPTSAPSKSGASVASVGSLVLSTAVAAVVYFAM